MLIGTSNQPVTEGQQENSSCQEEVLGTMISQHYFRTFYLDTTILRYS